MTQAQVTKHVTAKKKKLDEGKNQKDLAVIYEVAKPVLVFLSTFFVIPAKWRDVIKALVAVLDIQTTEI